MKRKPDLRGKLRGDSAPPDLEREIAAAVVDHREGRLAEAEAGYRRILEDAPDHTGALHNLGIIAAEDGRHEAALELFERALAVDPGYAQAHLNKGGALQELGRLDAALTSYDRALAVEPGMAEAHSRTGDILMRQLRFADAVAGYRDALARDADHYGAHWGLGLALTAVDRRGEALEQFGWTASYRRRRALLAPVRVTSRARLRHDGAQCRHLAAAGVDPGRFAALADAYDSVERDIDWAQAGDRPVALTDDQRRRLEDAYDLPIHVAGAPEAPGSAINRSLDVAAITASYVAATPGVATIDDLLTPAALSGLRRFLLDSTIWFDLTHIEGFLAAYLEDGLACPLLLQIAGDLRRAFPAILGDQPLTQLWAFKCLTGDKGIDVHADAGAVSVNFWLTPDSANRDPDHGGLVVYRTPPPVGWKLSNYDDDIEPIRAFLAEHDSDRVIVPYRENRAVLFDSALFHESGAVDFKPGYRNHRINMTMLFGTA